MAGHSKWNNIRIKKGRVDAKRGKLFTKLARDILVAGKDGSDPESNFRLKIAITKAKKENLPANNIERLLKKLAGEGADEVEETTYEGYGQGGVAIMVEAATDNRNRTAAEVRLAFNKKWGQHRRGGLRGLAVRPARAAFRLSQGGVRRGSVPGRHRGRRPGCGRG